MNQISENNHHFDEIDLRELVSILIKDKLKIVFFTILASISGIFLSLSIQETYTSRSILAPAENNIDISKTVNQYSNAARALGVAMPSSGGADRVTRSIEIIKSLQFFENFVDKHNLMIPLVAAKGWDKSSNTLIIDKDMYDVSNKKWVSEQSFAVNGKPSIQSAHRLFLKNFSIAIDQKTGLIHLSYIHYSSFFAQEVLNLLISDINEITRNEDISKARTSIKFLEKEIISTQLTEIKSDLNSLVKKHIEIIVLANASPEYLFKILSGASAPEIKSGPNRVLICIISFFVGFSLISCYVLSSHYLSDSKKD